jgi:hypothetical protein
MWTWPRSATQCGAVAPSCGKAERQRPRGRFKGDGGECEHSHLFSIFASWVSATGDGHGVLQIGWTKRMRSRRSRTGASAGRAPCWPP